METAGYYRLDTTQARQICDQVTTVVTAWQTQAKRLGITASEQSDAAHLIAC